MLASGAGRSIWSRDERERESCTLLPSATSERSGRREVQKGSLPRERRHPSDACPLQRRRLHPFGQTSGHLRPSKASEAAPDAGLRPEIDGHGGGDPPRGPSPAVSGPTRGPTRPTRSRRREDDCLARRNARSISAMAGSLGPNGASHESARTCVGEGQRTPHRHASCCASGDGVGGWRITVSLFLSSGGVARRLQSRPGTGIVARTSSKNREWRII
jgi:hypothetical protein